ncbi:MAG: hypothetical protein C0408_08205, partial [Odoribacter sp.]|nr:hypothetical protein [Odoribacter sp.]
MNFLNLPDKMKPNIFNLILRSLLFYRKSSVYQAVIIFILAAIITGSLLTGHSVRQSLRTSVTEHLGNASVLISSGLRYFDGTMAGKISEGTAEKCVALLETSGYCQNFTSGVTALNTKVYGINHDFFPFLGNDSVVVSPGTVAVNQNLAQHLGIVPGDEIIIHFRELSPIPASSPFARPEPENVSKVLKVSHILKPDQNGNFTLGISQIVPMSVFLDLSDMSSGTGPFRKANRLLVENNRNITPAAFNSTLKQSISPEDIGLIVRQNEKTGGIEIISERIFIDQEIIDEITQILPSARPVITYLANSICKNS